MNTDIKTMTETELKALAYDQAALMNQAQINIKFIEQEIADRKSKEKDSNVQQEISD